jgi:hypothetical protein
MGTHQAPTTRPAQARANARSREALYPALPVRGRMPRRESSTKCLIHGARRGRVPRRGELKNATEGIFSVSLVYAPPVIMPHAFGEIPT